MKTPAVLCLTLLSAATVSVFTGCDRAPVASVPPPPTASPSATPTPLTATDTADRAKKEGDEAAQAAGDLLREKGAKLRDSLRQAGDQLGIDKENLRREIEDAKLRFGPQIEELKRRAAAAGEEAKPEINRQIANLEEQRKNADVKLDQLKSATGDAWKAFKTRWKQEQAAATPAPTVTPVP